MQKIMVMFLFCFVLSKAYGQKENKVTTYLLTQFNETVHDVTQGNNPWGIGFGLQTFFNNRTKFTPTVELTGDIYLADDDVFRMHTDGTAIDDVPGMVNLFVGTSFTLTQNTYLSFVAGPGFIYDQTFFGIKPSMGFYFSAAKRWVGKVSYINIFNRDKATGEDFGSISVAIGLKLF